MRDPAEPFSVTDNEGEYVIYDIQPPDGTYKLREKLVPRRRTTRAVATDWICSFPNDTHAGRQRQRARRPLRLRLGRDRRHGRPECDRP